MGATQTSSFYTNLTNVKPADLNVKMVDVSPQVLIWPVGPADDGAEIRPFIEKRINGPMLKGAAFYQLVKSVPIVQDYKKILIRDKNTQAIYHGSAARQILGLPTVGNIALRPGNHGNYDIFIQSTSVNRKLQKGTSLIYWTNA